MDRRRVVQAVGVGWLMGLFGFDWPGHREVDAGIVEDLVLAAERLEQWDTASGVAPKFIAAARSEALKALSLPCRPELRGELHSAVGEISHTVGYMAFDRGDLPAARSSFSDTLDIAGDTEGLLGVSLTHRARLSIARAHLTRYRINSLQPHRALEWVTGADDERLTPTERALACQVQARAFAIVGDRQGVLRTVGQAGELHAQASPATDPPWVATSGEAEHLGDTGHALADLALINPDVAGEVLRDADTRLLRAADHPQAHRRTRLLSRLVAATLSMRYVDPGRAVEIAAPGLQLAALTPSAQAVAVARQLQQASQAHLGRDEVAWLHRQLGGVTAASVAEN